MIRVRIGIAIGQDRTGSSWHFRFGSGLDGQNRHRALTLTLIGLEGSDVGLAVTLGEAKILFLRPNWGFRGLGLGLGLGLRG